MMQKKKNILIEKVAKQKKTSNKNLITCTTIPPVPDYERKKVLLTFAYHMSNFTTSITSICKDLGHTISTIREWINNDEELRDIYTRAAVDRAYIYRDLCVKIADEIAEFWDSEETHPSGLSYIKRRERVSAVNKAKLRIDQYNLWASHLLPTEFGDNAKEVRQLIKDMSAIKAKLEIEQ